MNTGTLIPLRVQNAWSRDNNSDIHGAADRGDVTFPCLLDLSAAFDTVDHDIFVDRLERVFGLRGLVL